MKIKFENLTDTDQIIYAHMNDYHSGGGESCEQYVEQFTFKAFTESYLKELIEEGMSPREAFDVVRSGSGDGQENFMILCLRDGKVMNIV